MAGPVHERAKRTVGNCLAVVTLALEHTHDLAPHSIDGFLVEAWMKNHIGEQTQGWVEALAQRAYHREATVGIRVGAQAGTELVQLPRQLGRGAGACAMAERGCNELGQARLVRRIG